MKLFFRYLVLTLIISPVLFASPRPDWTLYASRLTGESKKIRQQAIQSLKKFPNLNTELSRALVTEQCYLALDTISSLSLTSFLPELMKLSASDSNGAFFLGINTLINKNNLQLVAQFYRDSLLKRWFNAPKAPVKIILLDTLGRIGAAVSSKHLLSMLRNDSYEVRMAVVSFLRHFLLRKKHEHYLPILKEALNLNPYQLRLQTLFLFSELPEEWKQKFKPHLSSCMNDTNDEVRRLCNQLGKSS